MKVYTVKDLYEELSCLVASGLGDKIVLIPDPAEDTMIDYRTIGSIDSVTNIGGGYIYFEFNNDEEEEEFWG